MRIGINLLYLIPRKVGGTETYAAGLLNGLAQIPSENEFVIFVNQQAADWPIPLQPNFQRIICPVNGVKRYQRYYYEQIKLPKLLKKEKIDLIHSLGYVGPVNCPCPSILTIPDTNFFDLAKTIPVQRRIPLRTASTLAARSASQIITISEFSKNRISQTMKIPPDKIRVTHLAPHPYFVESAAENWFNLKLKYQIKEPYIVAFGGRSVHKNISTLIDAFKNLMNEITHNLVLIGNLPSNINLREKTLPKELTDRIIATGYIASADIAPILKHADLFVMPSLYEGFGLPVLEAQQEGVAVICSTAGSLPEIAGAGAALFDPTSSTDLAKTIREVLRNTETQTNLTNRGYENLLRFSWKITALETMSAYKKALGIQ